MDVWTSTLENIKQVETIIETRLWCYLRSQTTEESAEFSSDSRVASKRYKQTLRCLKHETVTTS